MPGVVRRPSGDVLSCSPSRSEVAGPPALTRRFASRPFAGRDERVGRVRCAGGRRGRRLCGSRSVGFGPRPLFVTKRRFTKG
eukprot:6431487-Pyramimonas_sp.AAC.1